MAALVSLLLPACGLLSHHGGSSDDDMADATIEEVLEHHTPAWMRLHGVVGTGIGLCQGDVPCIRIFLSAPSPETEAAIPRKVDGYPVDLVVTGLIRPRPPGR